MLSEHLSHPRGRGICPAGGYTGAAGGAACGDLIRVSLATDGERVTGAGFDASGCGTALAAGSGVIALVERRGLLEAARIGPAEISAELGGLSPAKQHAAELAADALHRALGAAARAQASLAPEPGRTLVAMSGGVDSAVAAHLAGPGAVGVTLELWSDPHNDGERSCCSPQAVRTARELAHTMGLPHFSIDLREEFRSGVIEPWIRDHASGLTPNPCVRCNGGVRLEAMAAFAERLGAEALATGHYARVEDGLLRAALDTSKDQSYMLAGLSTELIARLRFPLGGMLKPDVRALATRAGLSVAQKPDSQDLCFLAGTGRAAFLARHGGFEDRPGPIVDRRGRTLGRHRGAHHFTVGQRRGLGVAAGEPLYVLEKAGDTVVAGRRDELAVERLAVRDVTLHRSAASIDAVRVRHRGRSLPCRAHEALAPGHHASLDLLFDQPAGAAAPGQTAALLCGELIVGHATIE